MCKARFKAHTGEYQLATKRCRCSFQCPTTELVPVNCLQWEWFRVRFGSLESFQHIRLQLAVLTVRIDCSWLKLCIPNRICSCHFGAKLTCLSGAWVLIANLHILYMRRDRTPDYIIRETPIGWYIITWTHSNTTTATHSPSCEQDGSGTMVLSMFQ